MVEKVVAPLKRVSAASGQTAAALKAARDRLKELNAQQAAVGHVQKQQAELARLNNELKTKQALLAGLKASGTATVAQLKREENGVRTLTTALVAQRERAGQARMELARLGITGNLSAAQARLAADINQATHAMQRQRTELQRLAEQQRRLTELNARHAKSMMHTGMAAGAGVAMAAAGRRGVQATMAPVRDYSKHQDHMLGIARQVEGARDEAGNLTPVYRAIEEQVRGLSHQVPLATTAIADMVTAAARMEVPTDKLAKFTLMASEMATAFDAVPDQVTESMGKVAKNFKIPLTDIRGLADSINYLDDNAISKGADIIDFLNRTSGVVSTVAMSARDAAALGSTLLTLGERTETASTAANAIVQKFAAATKGTKKFQAAMAEIGLSSRAVQEGMSKDATATLLKVIEAVRKLPESQRIGVMVELVGMEHSDTLAKLVDKPEELQRQLKLANGKEAEGSMAREASARNATLSAQWQMTCNRAFNLSATVGEALEPVLLRLLRVVNPLIEGFSRWIRAHPVLVKWLLGAAVGVSALLAVLGTLLVPLALIAGKVLLLRFLFARLALTATGPLAAALTAARGLVLGVGRALLTIPGVALLAAIAGAGLLIYKYWQPLAAFFAGLWAGFTDALAPAFAAVDQALGPLRPVLDWLMGALGGLWNWFTSLLTPMQATQQELAGITNAGQFLGQVLGTLVMGFLSIPSAFVELGTNVIQGFVNGLTSGAAQLRDVVVNMADSVSGWFREKLGIASPSRLFVQYGGWVSEGAALGITAGQDGVRKAALAMAAAATVTLPAVAGPVPPSAWTMQVPPASLAAAATMAQPTPAATGLPSAQIAHPPPALMAAARAAPSSTTGWTGSAITIDRTPAMGAAGAQRAPAAAPAQPAINITINAAPGMDERALARAVAAELRRQADMQRSRVLSSMTDSGD